MDDAKYWQKRMDEINKIVDRDIDKVNQKIARLYQQANAEIAEIVEKNYNKIMVRASKNIIRPNDYYTYQRYMDMSDNINKILRDMGQNEVKITENHLLAMYDKTFEFTGEVLKQSPISVGLNLAIVNKSAAEVVAQAWCQGKHFSDRIWDNKNAIVEDITRQVQSIITTGNSYDRAAQVIMDDCSVGYNQAVRIVRTETTYVQGQACANRFRDAGITKYQLLTAHDSRVCPVCIELDKKIFDFSNMQIGVNYPPLHPNCRDVIVPIKN